MKLTPAIKGQLTKACNASYEYRMNLSPSRAVAMRRCFLRAILERYMPSEQAKHAARKYADG